MARRTFFVATLALIMLACFAAHVSAQNGKAVGRHRVAGAILVKFKPGADANAKADAHRNGGGRRMNEITGTGLQLVAVPNGDEAAAVARYRRNPHVLYAEPNYVRSIPETSSQVSGSQIMPGDHNFRE